MKTYLKEIGVLGILVVLSIAALRNDSFLYSFFGVPSSEITQAIAPQLASQSYVQQSEADVETAIPTAIVENGAVSAGLSSGSLFSVRTTEQPPNLLMQAALIADLETGETYYSLRAGEVWPIASLTKLMTAAYATLHIGAPTAITLPETLSTHISEDSTGVLRSGETYAAFDLMKAMLTFSSNEAAEGLASEVGRDAFLKGMNDMAETWGLVDTTFIDPTGLSASNQSTPQDILIMMRNMYRVYPDLLAMTRTPSTVLTEQGANRAMRYANINQFAGRADFLGGKTGYTDEAQGNLVSLFAYENRPIAIIVLGTSDRFGATQALFSWFKRTHTSR